MEIDLTQFHQSFFEESLEMLADMEKVLLEIDPSQPLDKDKINRIFRAMHSMKGGSATFGFDIIRDFTHTIENYLSQVRNGAFSLTKETIDLLLKAVDCLRDLIADLRQKKSLTPEIVEPLQSAFKRLLSSSNIPVESKKNEPEQIATTPSQKRWEILFSPNQNIFFSGNDPVHFFQALKEFGALTVIIDIDHLPPFDDINPENCYLSWKLILEADIDQQAIEAIFEWVRDISHLEVKPAGTEKNSVPEKTVASTASENIIKNIDSASIRVSTEKIDALINIIGEMVITRSALTQLYQDYEQLQLPELKKILLQLELNGQELQEYAFRIRMLPANFIFDRFPRMVKEFSEKLEKQVELQIEGGETEIDKSILEKLVDPLQHLVRNAIDHGIETPAERVAANKSPIGKIRLEAYQHSGNIFISITDDGRGLSRNKILAKASKLGLVNKEDTLTDREVYDLIFKPGFSTSNVVSEISGRGVGLDVVLQNIISLDGSISFHTTPGEGATFILKLPLTLAILNCQLVTAESQTYILPLNSIVEIIDVDSKQISSMSDQRKFYQKNETYIPVYSLKEILHIPSDFKNIDKTHDTRIERSTTTLVVIEAQNKQFGILIDKLLEQQQIVIKNLEDNFQKVAGIAGATILGNGRVALIFDTNYLVDYVPNKIEVQEIGELAIEEVDSTWEKTQTDLIKDKITQILIFKIGEQQYAIDMNNVSEIRTPTPITPIPNVQSYVTGAINLNGLIVPIVDLRVRLDKVISEFTRATTFVILKFMEQQKTRLVGIIVDAVANTYLLEKNSIQPIPVNKDQVEPFFIGLISVNSKMIILVNVLKILPKSTSSLSNLEVSNYENT